MNNQTRQMYKQFVANAQQRAAASLTGDDLVNYFLINGIDYKGQTQVGLLASGYGAGVGLAASAGIVSLGVNAGVDALKRAIVVVQRGPSQLDGELITTPLILLSLIGRQWSGKLDLSAQAGVSAEVGWSFGSDGASTTATHTFKEEPEDPSTSAELIGAAASAFAAVSLEAGAAVDHYWGFDPAPGYYGLHDGWGAPLAADLRLHLAQTLSDGNREKALCDEARALVNELRRQITASYGNDPAAAERSKKQLGIWFTTLANDKEVAKLSTSEAVSALAKISDAAQLPILNKLAGPTIQGRAFAERAKDLLRRLRPYSADKKSCEPVCWLRMRSAKLQLGGGVGAGAQTSVASPIAKLEAAASASLAKAGVRYQRTGVLWQTQLAASDRGALFCAQETAITYTSLSAQALAVGVNAEAAAGTLKHGYEFDAATIRRDLNVMSYTCATLYWRRPAGASAAAALPGSGLTYGQSFVVKNLRAAIKASKSKGAPTRWIARMAERLRVSPAALMSFLSAAAVTDILTDLCTSSQTTRVFKNAADPQDTDSAWDDRAVLIEASFALDGAPGRPTVTIDGAVPKGITAALSPAAASSSRSACAFGSATRAATRTPGPSGSRCSAPA